MTNQTKVIVGSFPGDPIADNIRNGFVKVNQNIDTVDSSLSILNGAVFNVKTYGALGNGTADDSGAIQAAINAAGAVGGGVVYVPPTGTFYRIDTGLTVPRGVKLMGAGTRNGIATNFGGFTASTISQSGSWIKSNDLTNSAVKLTGAGAVVEGLNFTFDQPADSAGWTPNQYPYAITIANMFQRVDNCWIMGASHGILAQSLNQGGAPNNDGGLPGTVIRNCNLTCYNRGLVTDGLQDTCIIENVFVQAEQGTRQMQYQVNNLTGWYAKRADNPFVNNVEFFIGRYGIFLDDTTDGASIGNCILSNMQFLFVAQAVACGTNSINSAGVLMSNCFFQNAGLGGAVGISVTGGVGAMLQLNSDNIEWQFNNCYFFADGNILTLGNGGTGTHTQSGFPNCIFTNCHFFYNLFQSGTSAFNLAANSQVQAAAYFIRGGLSTSVRTGSGTLTVPQTTTL